MSALGTVAKIQTRYDSCPQEAKNQVDTVKCLRQMMTTTSTEFV